MVGNQQLGRGSFFGRNGSASRTGDYGTGETGRSASRTGDCGTGGANGRLGKARRTERTGTSGSASRTGDCGAGGTGGTQVGQVRHRWDRWDR